MTKLISLVTSAALLNGVAIAQNKWPKEQIGKLTRALNSQ